MSEGYIKLHRKLLDNPIAHKPNMLAFWVWCLMKASHKECRVMVGYQEVVLQPGQFIFGRKQASKDTGLSEREIRTCLTFLKNFKNMTIQTTNKYSVVSIVNWADYQSEATNNSTSKRPASDQQATTNKNGKNVKNVKKGIYGEFQNVHLTDDEVEKLKAKLNSHFQEYIENLSTYKQSKGKSYKDDYATILNWSRKDDRESTNKNISNRTQRKNPLWENAE